MPFIVRTLFAPEEGPEAVLRDDFHVCGRFETRDEAEAERARLEGELRRGNPFDLWHQASLCDLTSLEPAILCDWMRDAGIEPPGPDEWGRRDWEAWWGESSPRWGDEQRAHAWKAMDRARGYEVVEVRPTRKLFVIMERGWVWCDEPPWRSGPDTMQPREAYTTLQRAQTRLAELLGRKRVEWDDEEEFSWADAGGGEHEGGAQAAPFYEIIEVEEEA